MSKLYVVGIGPGGERGLTAEACAALERCDLLCGYAAYIALIAPLFPRARIVSSGMTEEVERCRAALAAAAGGEVVGLVCSGDAGVYGMAGLALELAPDYPRAELEVVAGVTAAQSGGAVLGAPLGHDYAVISLSDLLTPWGAIERRLVAAAQADFCICLYNPRSKGRPGHLARAGEILLRYKAGATPCGWVRNIGRTGEQHGILSLAELPALNADMFTTVFVGNAETVRRGDRMITPRGYGGLR